MLTDQEQNEVVDLYEREAARQVAEDDKIARNQARQLGILMTGGSEISRETASASFENLYNDLQDSPTFMIKKTAIASAQRFLRSVQLKEYADRLWRYEGVAHPPVLWNEFVSRMNEPSSVTGSAILEDDAFQTLKNTNVGRLRGEKRKEAMIRKVDTLMSGTKPVKRRRVEHKPISAKLPSRLRNSISSDNLEEHVALDPPALQAAFSPHRQPAPPSRRHPVKEKRPVTPRFRFVKKSPKHSSVFQTPPGNFTTHSSIPLTRLRRENRRTAG